MLGLADAALVAEHCDGLMLLVSLDRVDRGLPKESISRIRSSGAPLLGVITNALKEEKQSSAYGYGYGKYGYGKYGYGYGYGGYGYAAYDTSNAYAYYANTEAEEEQATLSSAKETSSQRIENKGENEQRITLRRQWRNQRQRFIQWLDS